MIFFMLLFAFKNTFLIFVYKIKSGRGKYRAFYMAV